MDESRPHLKTLEEMEKTCAYPASSRSCAQRGLKACATPCGTWTGWHRDYDPCVWRSRATDEQKRVGWEMWVRMEKIIATVLYEAHERQVREAMDALAEGPESFYKSYLERKED